MQASQNLSAAEKTAILGVLAGEGPGVITEMCHFLYLHMPDQIRVSALELLIKDQLRGEKLAKILANDFCYDYLRFQHWLTARLVKEKQRDVRLIAGQNFKTV